MKIILIILLFIISNTVCCKNNTISNIYCSGFKRVSVDTVLFKLPLKKGGIVNDVNISDSIKILFSMGYFDEIKIFIDNKNAGTVFIKVKERPIINNITWSGNKIVQSNFIEQILDMKKVQVGQTLNGYSIFELKRLLLDLCYDFGKFNAVVKIITIFMPRNCVDLKIVFSEGKTTKISKINIFGNQKFTKKRLLSCFQEYYPGRLWLTFFRQNYQKDKFLYYLEKLNHFYTKRGYANFHVDSTQINFTPDKKFIHISLHITEGKKYLFSSVILSGNILHYFPDFQKSIIINSGTIYNADIIKKIENKIQCVLSENGYIQPFILIEPVSNVNNELITLYVHVDVGKRFYVHEIFFEGNNFTQDSVIRNKIYQKEYTLLNYSCVLQDQARLNYLGFFKTVEAHIKYVPHSFDQIDILYQVTECNTGNLNLSIGIGTESGINAQFGMDQKNFLGTGNNLSVVSTKNSYQTYAEISASQLNKNISSSILEEKIFYSHNTKNRLDYLTYNLKNYGINFNCFYPITEHHMFHSGLHCISNHLNKISPQVAIWRYLKSININPDIFMNSCDSKNFKFHINDVFLVLGWTFNDINHLYFPTLGSRINLSGNITCPGSKNKYYKIIANGNYYVSLDKDSYWVLMGSVHIGFSGKISYTEPPFYDNFFVGGINTIRGFRLNSIGPKSVYYFYDDYEKHNDTFFMENSTDSIGGNAMATGTAELIVPISIFNSQCCDMIRVSLFLDMGTLWDTFWENTDIIHTFKIPDYGTPKNIRLSSGISLKWISPIGPIILSYSKIVKKYLGDIEEPFQFSIGKTW